MHPDIAFLLAYPYTKCVAIFFSHNAMGILWSHRYCHFFPAKNIFEILVQCLIYFNYILQLKQGQFTYIF